MTRISLWDQTTEQICSVIWLSLHIVAVIRSKKNISLLYKIFEIWELRTVQLYHTTMRKIVFLLILFDLILHKFFTHPSIIILTDSYNYTKYLDVCRYRIKYVLGYYNVEYNPLIKLLFYIHKYIHLLESLIKIN